MAENKKKSTGAGSNGVNQGFGDKLWSGARLRNDLRWKYGVPPAGNANYAWRQNIVHHLKPRGTVVVVLAIGDFGWLTQLADRLIKPRNGSKGAERARGGASG